MSESPRPGRATAQHRTDIDGLRALAVLPVLAYHVGIHAVPGGFVGVDIFFVISGYLITQVVAREIAAEKFSLARFYERRIRRIFPALLAVLAATSILELMLGLPSELVDYSRSLVAAVLSVSNVYFWLTSGYFDSPALSKPLLHTWSLAVEEQFYIFWPLFLMAAFRLFNHRLLPATLAVIVVSLGISAYGAIHFESATFYLVHTRAWELLLGGILAIGAFAAPLGPLARNLTAAVGLALIAGSVLLINQDMPFPGLVAVPPCLGAALILLAGRDGGSVVFQVLSFRPLAFVGLISYSLYLWHWPLEVFQRNNALLMSGGSDRAQKLAVIAASLVLATISWRFIEQPFREGRWRPARGPLLAMAAAGSAVILAFGAVSLEAGGFPARYTAAQLQTASYLNYDARDMFRVGRCFLTGRDPQETYAPQCLQLDGQRRNFLLLGDSHAAELWSGLAAEFPGIHFLQATASDCFPTVTHALGEARKCVQLQDGIFHSFLADHRVDEVILAARWKAELLPNIEATLQWLHARHIPVTLIGPTVEFDSPVPRLLLTAARARDPDLVARHWDHSLWQLDQALRAAAQRSGATYVSMLQVQCPHQACSVTDAEGMPLITDREHFTIEGSRSVAHSLAAAGQWQVAAP